MSNKKVLLWDADYICYKHKVEDSLEEAIKKVDDHINWILEFSKADYFALFISEGKYFRHDLTRDKATGKVLYKSKRTYGVLPWVGCVKQYLKSKYNAFGVKGAEADDAVMFFQKKNIVIEYTVSHPEGIVSYRENYTEPQLDEADVFPIDATIVATDKDVLGNCVGTHINPVKKNKETGEYETIWHTTTEPEAKLHFWTQMLIGDTVDYIMGCGRKVSKVYKSGKKIGQYYEAREGIAPKTAENILKVCSEVQYKLAVFNEYIKMFGESQGMFEFQKNYRLLHMLDSDEDMLQELGYVPELPKFQKVNKPEEVKPVEIDF